MNIRDRMFLDWHLHQKWKKERLATQRERTHKWINKIQARDGHPPIPLENLYDPQYDKRKKNG